MATEPDDADHGDVQDQHGGGEQEDEELTDDLPHPGDVLVGGLEALGLGLLAHEGAHDADPGQLLAQHAVDGVQALLVGAEQRHHTAHGHPDHEQEHGHGHGDEPGQRGGAAHRHDDTADRQQRRGHQHGAAHEHEHLDLLNVVGGPGDQGAGPEDRHLALGEVPDATEDEGAQVAPHAQRGAGGQPGRPDGAGSLEHGHAEHEGANAPDIAGIASGNAGIDDVGIERGQVERGHHLHDLQDENPRQQGPVGAQIGAQKVGKHGFSVCVGQQCAPGGPMHRPGPTRTGER